MNNKTKIIIQFIFTMMLVLTFTHLVALASNASLPFTTKEYVNVQRPPDKPGQEILTDLVLGALSYVKLIVGVIGILFITILGLKLVMADGEEEKVTTAKKGLVYVIIAFVLVSMSQDLARIFDMRSKTLLSSPQDILERVRLFDRQIEILMTFIKYTLGAFATLMVVKSSLSLITAGGNEEETTKEKVAILYSGGGLLLIYVGQIFIEKVFYKVDKQVYSGISGVHPGVDAKEGVTQIIGITSMIVKIIGPIAVLMIIAGAIMYATAGSDEERTSQAKRLVIAAVMGIILIYGAFAIVSTVIASQLTQLGAIAA